VSNGLLAEVLCERCAKPAPYLYARDGKLVCVDCVTAAAVRVAQDGCLEERRITVANLTKQIHAVLTRAERAEAGLRIANAARDEAYDIGHKAIDERNAARAALRKATTHLSGTTPEDLLEEIRAVFGGEPAPVVRP
jgi:hypothetical protein